MASDMSLTSTLTVSINWTASKVVDLQNTQNRYTNSFQSTLANGTGAGQSDQIYFNNEDIAAGANYDLDVIGVVANCFEGTVNLARGKFIFVEHLSSSLASSIEVGASGGFEWIYPFAALGDKTNLLPAGSVFSCYTPDATAFPVVGGASDLLRIANNDGAQIANVRVIIIGVST